MPNINRLETIAGLASELAAAEARLTAAYEDVVDLKAKLVEVETDAKKDREALHLANARARRADEHATAIFKKYEEALDDQSWSLGHLFQGKVETVDTYESLESRVDVKIGAIPRLHWTFVTLRDFAKAPEHVLRQVAKDFGKKTGAEIEARVYDAMETAAKKARKGARP